ncbi:sterol desaturase family protein [Melittangium boletus]|uniref:sterol desaturase family protein n=1 Tax=Melittangium boletus TaxID=83453 RepID=UPI003DA4975C
MPLLPHRSPVDVALGVIVLNLVRYAIFAVPAFVLFHRRAPRRWLSRRLGPGPVTPRQARREVAYSLVSLTIFGLVGVLMYGLAQAGLSRFYVDDRYGLGWFLLSIPVMLLLHDTYFYWTHRFMHWKPVFKHVHRVHHLSHDPSPLAAYAFHPLEAVIEAGIGPLIMLTLPVHRHAFLIFLTIQLAMNVLGHLGFELFPRGFMRSPLGRFLNTTTHHHQHHQKTNWNFGLYFNLWDRLLGTNHPRYEEAFEAATTAPAAEEPEAVAWTVETR